MNAPGAKLSANVRGILFMVTAAALLTSMSTMVRTLIDTIPPVEVAFLRNFLGLVMLVPILARNGLEPFRTRMIPFMALRGAFNAAAMVLYFVALGMIPLSEITALNFTTPLFVALIAVPVFKERLGPRRIASLVVGFSGTLIILRPGVEVISLGAIYALGAAATWSTAIMIIKHMSRTESSVTITLYGMVFLGLFTMIPALFVWTWPSLEQAGVLVLIAAAGTCGQILFAQALKSADIGLVMPFDFTKLIWASLFGFLFFAEIPSAWALVGGTVIFASATYVTIREQRAGKSPPVAAPAIPSGAETEPPRVNLRSTAGEP